MEEKAAEPAIRFAEFAGAWEQRKFSKLYKRSSEKNDGSIGIERNITVATMQFKSDIRLSSDDYLKTYFTFKVGDIAFEGHQSKEFRYGRFVENDIGDGVVSHIFTVFRPIQRFDLHFWKYAINSENLMQKILSRSTKASTMMHDLVPEDFLNETFLVPSIDEQKAVGKFLHQIDNLLTLHQRKYEKLLNIKKSMLEKMFPKEGEVVPEIRFKGFTGAWEERKLGDIADITGGGTPSTSNNDYWDGIINWYSPAEISNQIFLNSSQRKITELGYSSCSAKMLPRGTVLFTSRAGIGKTAILSAEGCTNQGFQSIVPHANELDSYFIFSRTHELKKYGEVVGAGSTFVEVSGKQMAAMTLMMPPKFNEQKMIGDFFKRLDSILTLHQRKLEMLKNIKQAFLDKMFV